MFSKYVRNIDALAHAIVMLRMLIHATKFQSIQVARAVAALLVVATHIDVIGIGGFGVDIFFVISGFVIAYVGQDESGTGFLLRRVFRVVPLYWLGTLTVFLVAWRFPHVVNATHANPIELLKSLTFVPFLKENGLVQPVLFLGWTLNYEAFFYLLFALSLWLAPRHAIALTTLALVILTAVGQLLTISSVPLAFWTRSITLEFAAGMWLFVTVKRGALRNLPVVAALAIFASCIIGLAMIETHSVQSRAAYGILALMAVASLLLIDARVAWPFWLTAIGDASYSLYLFHPYIVLPPQRWSQHHGVGIYGQLAISACGVLVAVVFALWCYRFVEKPSNEWLRRRFLPSERHNPRIYTQAPNP